HGRAGVPCRATLRHQPVAPVGRTARSVGSGLPVTASRSGLQGLGMGTTVRGGRAPSAARACGRQRRRGPDRGRASRPFRRRDARGRRSPLSRLSRRRPRSLSLARHARPDRLRRTRATCRGGRRTGRRDRRARRAHGRRCRGHSCRGPAGRPPSPCRKQPRLALSARPLAESTHHLDATLVAGVGTRVGLLAPPRTRLLPPTRDTRDRLLVPTRVALALCGRGSGSGAGRPRGGGDASRCRRRGIDRLGRREFAGARGDARRRRARRPHRRRNLPRRDRLARRPLPGYDSDRRPPAPRRRRIGQVGIVKTGQEWRGVLDAYAEPRLGRSLLDLATSAAPYLVLLVAMTLALRVSVLLSLGLVVPASAFLIRIFIVFHDCTHGSFMRSRRANDALGVALGLLVWLPYRSWQHEHAVHHATAGDLDRRGVGDIATLTVAEYDALPAWRQITYRLYRSPAVMFGLGWFLVLMLKPRLVPRGARRRVRNSVLATNLVLALVVAAACLTIG